MLRRIVVNYSRQRSSMVLQKVISWSMDAWNIGPDWIYRMSNVLCNDRRQDRENANALTCDVRCRSRNTVEINFGTYYLIVLLVDIKYNSRSLTYIVWLNSHTAVATRSDTISNICLQDASSYSLRHRIIQSFLWATSQSLCYGHYIFYSRTRLKDDCVVSCILTGRYTWPIISAIASLAPEFVSKKFLCTIHVIKEAYTCKTLAGWENRFIGDNGRAVKVTVTSRRLNTSRSTRDDWVTSSIALA